MEVALMNVMDLPYVGDAILVDGPVGWQWSAAIAGALFLTAAGLALLKTAGFLEREKPGQRSL
jgi:hypothetical protein